MNKNQLSARDTVPFQRTLIWGASVAAVLIGCSSSSDDSAAGPQGPGGFDNFGGQNNQSGYGNFGAFGGTQGGGGQGQGGQQIPPPPATCNNGQLDTGEECDGPVNQTCESATLGARPVGTVTCTNCYIDTNGCTSNNPGNGGTGGGLGTGGTVGTGGGVNLGGSGNGSGGSIGGNGSSPTNLPTPKGTCQPFVTGDMTFSGQQVKVWAGPSKGGPLVIYWYATFSSVAEVTSGLGQAAINEITGMGGIVAAMYKTTATGSTTGNNVWYTGDFDIADEIVACAIQEHNIDTRHIHAIGFSAGGLQSGYMAYARSNYIASVVTYSGGSLSSTLADPSNAPPVMCQHGDQGSDVVVIDFSQASAALESNIRSHGSYAMDCNHGGGHLIPAADVGASWHFMKDHPFKGSPEPYANGIPAGFPSYCKSVP
ncbi:MAG TPA: hypothetical protein VHE30_25100 [Polyangiaceae bacterium]|nr:hypothetical protein [Polyangiaceae bacterium]